MPSRRLCSIALVAALLAGLAGAATTPASALNDSLFARQWGLSKIGAPTAWDAGLYGEGVDIAIIDTGVHLGHQEFTGRLGPGRNFITPGAPAQDDHCDDGTPDDDPHNCGRGGHGTHVAGIAGAGIDNGGSVGVAPKARIMPVKVLDEDGRGFFDDAAAGIRWSVDNGAEVVNLSLGGTLQGLEGAPEVLNAAVDYAWSKGVICVFAAGNSFILGSGFANQPALVVSATNRDDAKPDFSSGVGRAKWALAAPGGGDTVRFREDENIWSSVWVSDTRRDTYTDLRGTSMSAPFVAGAAAVLRAAGLTPQQTVDRLLATAKDIGPPGRDSTFGAGRLDLAKAVQGLSPSTGPAPTTVSPAPPVGPSSTTTAPPPAGSRRQSNGGPRPAPTPAPAPATPTAPAEGAAEPPAEIVEAPAAPVDPDDGFLPDEDGDDADAGDEQALDATPIGDRDLPWPWVALAGVAALGVGGAAARLAWRRQLVGDAPQ